MAGNRQYCGDLSEVENVLPWRRKSGRGGKNPGMQNPEMKGKEAEKEKVWECPKANSLPCRLSLETGTLPTRMPCREPT